MGVNKAFCYQNNSNSILSKFKYVNSIQFQYNFNNFQAIQYNSDTIQAVRTHEYTSNAGGSGGVKEKLTISY